MGENGAPQAGLQTGPEDPAGRDRSGEKMGSGGRVLFGGNRGVKPGPKNLFLQGGSLSGSHFSPVPSRTSSSVDREAGGKKGEDLKKPGPSKEKEKEKEKEQEKAKEEESTVPTETLTPASKQKTKKNQTNSQQKSQPVQPT